VVRDPAKAGRRQCGGGMKRPRLSSLPCSLPSNTSNSIGIQISTYVAKTDFSRDQAGVIQSFIHKGLDGFSSHGSTSPSPPLASTYYLTINELHAERLKGGIPATQLLVHGTVVRTSSLPTKFGVSVLDELGEFVFQRIAVRSECFSGGAYREGFTCIQ
jgi:hypothetical protein